MYSGTTLKLLNYTKIHKQSWVQFYNEMFVILLAFEVQGRIAPHLKALMFESWYLASISRPTLISLKMVFSFIKQYQTGYQSCLAVIVP